MTIKVPIITSNANTSNIKQIRCNVLSLEKIYEEEQLLQPLGGGNVSGHLACLAWLGVHSLLVMEIHADRYTNPLRAA